jgi:hypothetical protein
VVTETELEELPSLVSEFERVIIKWIAKRHPDIAQALTPRA